VRTLVTGGAGFIGSNLVDALTGRGDEVLVIDDLSSGGRANLESALAAGARLLDADIGDPDAIAGAFAQHRPQTVMHLAAQIDVRRSVADPVFDLGLNVGATLNLLEASRRDSVERFLFASTGGAIYGEGAGRELPLAENAECLPDAPYGQSKLAAEGYLSMYERLYGLSTASLRLGNVYGPRQDPRGEAGVVAIFTGALLDGKRPRVFGDGLQTRDYIFVGDVVAAFLAADASRAVGSFNVGTGVETNVIELGAIIADTCGTEFEPEHVPARPGEVQRIAIDSSRAEAELGWTASTALREGLEATVSAVRGAQPSA
jgi:UDP-glucose 4-epimerase